MYMLTMPSYTYNVIITIGGAADCVINQILTEMDRMSSKSMSLPLELPIILISLTQPSSDLDVWTSLYTFHCLMNRYVLVMIIMKN